MEHEWDGGAQFLIGLPAYTLGDLVKADGQPDPVPTTVLLRCPEYGAFVPLFTDLNLAVRMLQRLRAPNKVILELPSRAAIDELLRAHATDDRVTHVGIDVGSLAGGNYGLFAAIPDALKSMKAAPVPANCP